MAGEIGVTGNKNEVTINLSFNTSNGSYSLSSTDTSLATISGLSFIIGGKTYTPTVNKSSTVNKKYRLNSWTMPSGSTVGTNSPSSSKSGSPNTTSDYTSSEVNYYTSHTSYDYKTLSISLSSTSGNVSGDTSYCTYTTTNDYTWKRVMAGTSPVTYSKTATVGVNKTLTGDSNYFSVSWSSFGLQVPGGSYYSATSATCMTVTLGSQRYVPVNTTATISGESISQKINGTFYLENKVNNYSFSSVTWDSTAGTGWNKYGSATTTDTKSSQQYRKSSTSYSPDFYSKFTFDASTGKISWSHRGGSTTYYNRVEDNSTFDIDDLSTTTYTHNSTDWNADDLTVTSQSKTSITISVPTISWKFTTKDGIILVGSKIKFIDKSGNETTINSLGGGYNS